MVCPPTATFYIRKIVCPIAGVNDNRTIHSCGGFTAGIHIQDESDTFVRPRIGISENIIVHIQALVIADDTAHIVAASSFDSSGEVVCLKAVSIPSLSYIGVAAEDTSNLITSGNRTSNRIVVGGHFNAVRCCLVGVTTSDNTACVITAGHHVAVKGASADGA